MRPTVTRRGKQNLTGSLTWQGSSCDYGRREGTQPCVREGVFFCPGRLQKWRFIPTTHFSELAHSCLQPKTIQTRRLPSPHLSLGSVEKTSTKMCFWQPVNQICSESLKIPNSVKTADSNNPTGMWRELQHWIVLVVIERGV